MRVASDTLVQLFSLSGFNRQQAGTNQQESEDEHRLSNGAVMSTVQIEQKSYEMPPKEGISIAQFLTVADIERSARYYERVFGADSDHG